jgi:hypothetical protein
MTLRVPSRANRPVRVGARAALADRYAATIQGLTVDVVVVLAESPGSCGSCSEHSATIDVLDEGEHVVRTGRYRTDRDGYPADNRQCTPLAPACLAVEGYNGIGKHLTRRWRSTEPATQPTQSSVAAHRPAHCRRCPTRYAAAVEVSHLAPKLRPHSINRNILARGA